MVSREDRSGPSGGLSPSAMAVLGLLGGLGMAIPPASLATETGLAPRTVSKALRELRDAGLVAGPERSPGLTLAGRARACRALPVPAGSWDERVAEVLPVWHAAAVRLIADAIVARALGPAGPALPGFVAVGPVATFKSSLAEVVVAMFGMERTSAIVANSSALSPGAVIGRRERHGPGWRFVASGYVAQRFVCFDELAEADPAVLREVTQLLYGERVVDYEAERVEIAPVTLACFNPPGTKRPGLLGEGTWRRVLRLDTTRLRPAIPAGLGRRLGALLGAGAPPVDLAGLSWPEAGLPEAAREVWDDIYGQVLSDLGRSYHDERVFEALALGRAARRAHSGAAEASLDALGVGIDILLLAETVDGLVAEEGWRLNLEGRWAELSGLEGFASLAATVAARVEAAERLRRGARESELAAEVRSIELVGARAALAERLRSAAKAITRGLDVDQRPSAAGLRAQLSRLSASAAEARSAERLGEIEALARPLVEAAADLAAEAERRRRDRTAEAAARAAAAKQDAELARAAERRRKALAAEAAKREREARRERAKRLSELERLAGRKRTKPGEDVAAALVEAGCLRVEARETRRVRDGFLDRLSGDYGKTEIRRVVTYVDLDGRSYRASEVASWASPAVLGAIGAARRALVAARPAPLSLDAGGLPALELPSVGRAGPAGTLGARGRPMTAEGLYGVPARNPRSDQPGP